MLEKTVKEVNEEIASVTAMIGSLPLVGKTIGTTPDKSNWHFKIVSLHAINTIKESFEGFTPQRGVSAEEVDGICDAIAATNFFVDSHTNNDGINAILKPVILIGEMGKHLVDQPIGELEAAGLATEVAYQYKLVVRNLSAIITERMNKTKRG